MVIATRPDHAVQVAFNADPNDPAAVPTWSNLTSPFLGASGAKRGKQYELDLAQSAQPSLAFLDPNEYLNPGNPSSPYAPNVVPLRQVLWQAMWPNTTVGNLLAGQLSPVLDPSFESYTNGASLSWVLTNGSGVTPTVTTTNPQQGTKSLTYNVTAGAGTSGVGLTITCIPGRQYTSSLYLRQTAANTTQIFINGDASGTSTATTGAYVRLTVTWTATQPTHQLWVTSTTTGTSGTCNVDAIQHEQAASASAFVTTGPVIYPVLRDYIQRGRRVRGARRHRPVDRSPQLYPRQSTHLLLGTERTAGRHQLRRNFRQQRPVIDPHGQPVRARPHLRGRRPDEGSR